MIGIVGRYLLCVALVLFSKDAFRQALGELRDTEPGSQLFAALQLVIGVSAAVGAVGVFRRARWAVPAIVSWGMATAGLLAAQPLFEPMDAEAEQGIWIGAAAMLVAAVLAAWYAHRLATPRRSANPSNQRRRSPDGLPDGTVAAEPVLAPAPINAAPRVPAEPLHTESPARSDARVRD